MAPVVNAIGIVVRDTAVSAAFYRRLGLTFDGSAEHRECELPGGLRLMLDSEETVRSFSPDWVAPSGSPRSALAFQCDSPAQVDSAYAELISAGAVSLHEPWDAFWGQRYATVTDPDGNGVDLFAALP